MAYRSRVLVVARLTMGSEDLREALVERNRRGEIEVTLLMPALEPGVTSRDATRERLDAAVAGLRDAGLEVRGIVGHHDAIQAVAEAWDPARYDEVFVVTLPGATSKWMQMDFPHRVSRMTDVPVTHVIARERPSAHPTGPPPHREQSPLGPLGVLAWSHPRSNG